MNYALHRGTILAMKISKYRVAQLEQIAKKAFKHYKRGLSLRNVQSILLEEGIKVSHTTIARMVKTLEEREEKGTIR